MPYRGHIHNGVVVLDEPSSLPEGTEVSIDPVVSPAERVMGLAAQVYEGLPPEDIAEVERIALERRSFFGGE